jgi:hypothetical protein
MGAAIELECLPAGGRPFCFGPARHFRLAGGQTVAIRPGLRAPEERHGGRLDDWITSPHAGVCDPLYACVACIGETGPIVGEACYDAAPDGASCGLRLRVADAWRRSGAAGCLITALAQSARESGYRCMVGQVLRHSARLRHFARVLGFRPLAAGPALLLIAKAL